MANPVHHSSTTSLAVEFIHFYSLLVDLTKALKSKERVNGEILTVICRETCIKSFQLVLPYPGGSFQTTVQKKKEIPHSFTDVWRLGTRLHHVVPRICCVVYPLPFGSPDDTGFLFTWNSTSLVLSFHFLIFTQYFILIAIFLGVVESSAWYFYRLSNNSVGRYSITSLFVVVLIANIRRTFTYVLVLLISMGIGVIKWNLGTTRVKLGLLSVLYLFFSSALQYIMELEAVHKVSIVEGGPSRFMIIVPNAFLSVGFYYWICLSLIRTVQQLTLRQQILKLTVYKLFLGVLSVVAAFTLGLVLFQAFTMYQKQGQKHDFKNWKISWIEEFFTEFLFLFVVGSVSLLWRPRENNINYTYAEFFVDGGGARVGGGGGGGDGGDSVILVETLTVVGGGELTQRRSEGVSSVQKEGGVGNVGSYDYEYEEDREKNILASMPHLDNFQRNLLAFDVPSDESGEIDIQSQIRKLD
eukprot:TRINITY_DN3297_c0_g1_i5.p1 TRINITY_DN3297_c0_g1~~TRINITY_DN3297_c0_g1_i5.p1  ORF type:complete len:469 (-),score=77.05 TRINITY_DN3297_c0_g1_i5:123-1529(-)